MSPSAPLRTFISGASASESRCVPFTATIRSLPGCRSGWPERYRGLAPPVLPTHRPRRAGKLAETQRSACTAPISLVLATSRMLTFLHAGPSSGFVHFGNTTPPAEAMLPDRTFDRLPSPSPMAVDRSPSPKRSPRPLVPQIDLAGRSPSGLPLIPERNRNLVVMHMYAACSPFTAPCSR